MTTTVDQNRMDELQWPRIVNKVITQKWTQLKNTLVMKDFVDYLIQKRVVTLDYWIGLKSKPVTESERTEDFLALVIKFDRPKYNYFLEALLHINRNDLVKDLVKAQTIKPKKFKPSQFQGTNTKDKPKKDTDQCPDSLKPDKQEGEVHSGQERNQYGGKNDKAKETTINHKKLPKLSVQDIVHDVNLDQSKAEATTTQNQHQDVGQLKSEQVKSAAAGQSQRPQDADHQKALNHQQLVTGKLHHGIGTADDNTKNRNANSRGQVTTQPDGPDKMSVANPEKEDEPTAETGMSETIAQTGESNIGSVKSKEKLLEIRETLIMNKEKELQEREETLVEREKSLQRRETELLSRESTLVEASKTNVSEVGPLPIPKYLQNLNQDGTSRSASTTQSTDIFADVREQLAEMRRIKSEVESEHTTVCCSPKEDYVKLEDLQVVQHDIEELKAEIATDRSSRQTLQEKVEDLKEEINELNITIQKLENEKENIKLEQERQMNKLKLSFKTATLNQNEGINNLKMQMKTKESECNSMKQNLYEVKKTAEELEKRVKKLENERNWFEEEIKRYEREVSSLREQLEEKETVVKELRKTLEDTESEKEDLVEELAEMKKEISYLKSEKKRLEQEKKTLLSRCVKPMWNQNSRRTPFQK